MANKRTCICCNPQYDEPVSNTGLFIIDNVQFHKLLDDIRCALSGYVISRDINIMLYVYSIMEISKMRTWFCRVIPIETFSLCLMVLFWDDSGNIKKWCEICHLPEQTLGQQLSDHFPERNLRVPDHTMLVIIWETMGYWKILGHVKTCHPIAFCYWDTNRLRNSCYWDTGTNGEFEIFCYWDTGTNVNLKIF